MEDSCKTLGQLPQEEPQHQKYQGPRPSMKGAGTEKAGEPWALKADRPVEPQAVLRGFRQGAHLSEPPTPRTAVLLVFRPSVVSDSAAPWAAARQAALSITNCRSSHKPTSIELVMPSNHLILCHPLLLLPSIFPSMRVFSNGSALRIMWPKSASASVLPMNTQD